VKNYYYVVSFNLNHPLIKDSLGSMGLIGKSMIEIKTRSKLFMVLNHIIPDIHDDFGSKLKFIFKDENEHPIQGVSLLNPIHADGTNSVQFVGGSRQWSENCHGSMIFVDRSNDFNENEDQSLNLDNWLIKYDIFFTTDAIEISHNSEYVINYVNFNNASVYH